MLTRNIVFHKNLTRGRSRNEIHSEFFDKKEQNLCVLKFY